MVIASTKMLSSLEDLNMQTDVLARPDAERIPLPVMPSDEYDHVIENEV